MLHMLHSVLRLQISCYVVLCVCKVCVYASALYAECPSYAVLRMPSELGWQRVLMIIFDAVQRNKQLLPQPRNTGNDTEYQVQ